MRAMDDDTLERKSPAKQMIKAVRRCRRKGLLLGLKQRKNDVAVAYAEMAKTAMRSLRFCDGGLKVSNMAASTPIHDVGETIEQHTQNKIPAISISPYDPR